MYLPMSDVIGMHSRLIKYSSHTLNNKKGSVSAHGLPRQRIASCYMHYS